MRMTCCLTALCALLGGCASFESIANQNRTKLTQLEERLGRGDKLTAVDVLFTMPAGPFVVSSGEVKKSGGARGEGSGRTFEVLNPYVVVTFERANPRQKIDVWWYYDAAPADSSATLEEPRYVNLCPVFFEGGIVKGTGNAPWQEFKRAKKIEDKDGRPTRAVSP